MMTTVELGFQRMNEKAFMTSTESSGLVKALLELDDAPASHSDEEFLDFQFKIADAKAREQEASEQLSDWRAAFASLQLRQAQEIAEFALTRRKEDEARIAQQANEINELRLCLEASELEVARVKGECASLLREKLQVEQEFAHELKYCESLRQNVKDLNQARDQMAVENADLRRSLDDAAVTTGRLKEALEEKASELAAWLGLEGAVLQARPFPNVDDEISPKAEEKMAYAVHNMDPHGPEAGQTHSQVTHESLDGVVKDDRFKEIGELPTPVKPAEKVITTFNEECGNMKHDVLSGRSLKFGEMSVRCPNDSCIPRRAISVRDLMAEERLLHVQNVSLKKEELIVTLKQKIKELQFELDSLQAQQQSKVELEPWDVDQRLCQSPTTEEVRENCEFECRLSDSSSTVEKAEVSDTVGLVSSISSSHHDCAGICMACDRLEVKTGEGGINRRVSGSAALLAMANDVCDSAETQASESLSSQERIEGSWVASRADLEDKHICPNQNKVWSVKSMSELVETITEELTKLMRVVNKTSSSSKRDSFANLETRLKSWSNITSKALQVKVSEGGALKEWGDLVADFLGQSRQELMTVNQRLHDCEDELSLMDKLRAESLAATQEINFLKHEINKLEAQNFNDHIEREEELTVLKKDLDHAHTLMAVAQRKAVEEHKLAISLKDQLRKVELELEHSKQGWAAEQDFIDSCLGDGSAAGFGEESGGSRNEIETLEKRVEELTYRLGENERELSELMVISGIDLDAVVAAKFRRIEQMLEDAKASDALLQTERSDLVSQVRSLKAKLAEVEHELHLENQQHVEILIRYEEEQGQLEALARSEKAALQAKLTHLEHLLMAKSKQLEVSQVGEFGAPQTQVLGLRANLLALGSNLAAEKQKAVDREATIKSQLNKEKERCADLESRLSSLQSTFMSLKSEMSETEQKEKRAQSQIEKLMVELGIAKEEVLKCEVRMQKTLRQAKEDVESEKRKLEESNNSLKQMEWHLCRQIELTEGLEREKAKIRGVLEEFEVQNMALEKERDELRTAYMQLSRQTAQRVGSTCCFLWIAKILCYAGAN